MLLGWISLLGLRILKPQEAPVLTLFGKVYRHEKGEEFYAVNPFCSSINLATTTKINQSGDRHSGHLWFSSVKSETDAEKQSKVKEKSKAGAAKHKNVKAKPKIPVKNVKKISVKVNPKHEKINLKQHSRRAPQKYKCAEFDGIFCVFFHFFNFFRKFSKKILTRRLNCDMIIISY